GRRRELDVLREAESVVVVALCDTVAVVLLEDAAGGVELVGDPEVVGGAAELPDRHAHALGRIVGRAWAGAHRPTGGGVLVARAESVVGQCREQQARRAEFALLASGALPGAGNDGSRKPGRVAKGVVAEMDVTGNIWNARWFDDRRQAAANMTAGGR